ncbi:MAG TPA: sigma-70 family RNA polymerase sigma factor [Bryobacteraceae bacterium]|nr:sigma-70 family RNA polymerase sigma factor [Bryobacteraceae bacterium]
MLFSVRIVESNDASRSADVTRWLKAWTNGDPAALDRLMPVVYEELRRMARRHIRNERAGHTLQTTALVNEAYLRLVDVRNVDWQHRAQFFAISSQMMRRILVDAARARGSQKRGGGAEHLNMDDVVPVSPDSEESIVALDLALDAFAKVAPRQAKVLEMRYFGGLSDEEISAVLKTSTRTVERDFQFAKTWLMRELSNAR